MEEVKRMMTEHQIADTRVEHLKDDDGNPVTCEQCKRPISRLTVVYTDGTDEVKENVGCKCKAIRQANEKQREINARTFDRGSIIYGDYKEKAFDDYHPSNDEQHFALKAARYYAEHFNDQLANQQNILFQGGFGTGKTHLAAAIRNAISKQNYKVLFMSLPDYVQKLKEEFSDRNQRHPIFKMAKDAELLVLDDVGANRMSEWEISELFRLVEARLGKCTIYTTNWTARDFTETQEINRVFSRMMQKTKVIPLNGPDHRMKGLM